MKSHMEGGLFEHLRVLTASRDASDQPNAGLRFGLRWE